MKIKAIKTKRIKPKYPTMDLFVNNPQLLSKSIPEKWLGNSLVYGSLTAFILCGNAEKAYSQLPETSIVLNNENDRPKADTNKTKDVQKKVSVAPIFAHGEGSGGTGCVSINPPVFISENEARQIIFDALKAENIVMDTINTPILKFEYPPIANFDYEEGDTNINNAKIDIKMLGYINKFNLAINFISYDDFDKFRAANNDGFMVMSSVQNYHTKKAAEIIREVLIKENNLNAVVFYDPIYNNDINKKKDWKKILNMKSEDWQKIDNLKKEEAKKLLLAQVEDFIKWIKAEGIIK